MKILKALAWTLFIGSFFTALLAVWSTPCTKDFPCPGHWGVTTGILVVYGLIAAFMAGGPGY